MAAGDGDEEVIGEDEEPEEAWLGPPDSPALNRAPLPQMEGGDGMEVCRPPDDEDEAAEHCFRHASLVSAMLSSLALVFEALQLDHQLDQGTPV